MGYYHIELYTRAKNLCTIVLTRGNYEYQELRMGMCKSPDILQENISELFIGFGMVHE